MLRRRWCPRGVHPPWIVQDQYEWLWVYVAVEPSRGTCVVLLLPSVRGAWFARFLTHVRQEIPEETIGLVCDNAPSHRSKQVTWPTGIVPRHLPPYSPELDPAEQIFKHVRGRLSNRLFADLDALEDALIAEVTQFWEHPQVIIQMTDYTWWQEAIETSLPSSP